MLKFLLDTNIIIYTIKNRPDSVRQSFNKHSGQLAVSSVTAGELYYGAEKSAKPQENLTVIEGLLNRVEVLPFETNAAAHFGEIRAKLEKQGNIIGAYDLMIAGHARSEGLILVTNNTKEFQRVEGLRLQNWVK